MKDYIRTVLHKRKRDGIKVAQVRDKCEAPINNKKPSDLKKKTVEISCLVEKLSACTEWSCSLKLIGWFVIQ